MATHNDLGKKGEQLAVDYLQENDYIILEKNYQFKKAEIDIIAKKEDTLVVVEVKTRSSTYFGNPEDFVSPKKIKLLVYAINHYLTEKNLDIEVRFDIIAVLKQKDLYKIRHLKDAFLYF